MRNAAGIAVALLIGFACSACGSFLLNGVPSGGSGHVVTISSTISSSLGPPVPQQLPLRRTGTGRESLGAFAIRGNVHVKVTCVGTGKIEVDFTGPRGEEGMGGVRCLGANTLALNSQSNLGELGSGPYRITVRAPATVTWLLDIVDRQPNS
jgi:hypothetical protein